MHSIRRRIDQFLNPLPQVKAVAGSKAGGRTKDNMHLRKDKSLDELAETGNIAQFVSFVPTSSGPKQAYARVAGHEPNAIFESSTQAIEALLVQSSEASVNVRSYTPENPRSREFVYGLKSVPEALAYLERLTAEGLHTIINETVDVEDGGVSGVAQDGIIEFAPDDTPRCVEKPGVASLPLDLGMELLETVYGFKPELGDQGGRVEFSIHPRPRGWRRTHTLLWEREPDAGFSANAGLSWPNRFSRHIGDKVFGLLMAHLAGARVPKTLCISRRVAPFHFGQNTGTAETWIRTAPCQQEPGKFTTHRGWLDPYRLMAAEDPEGTRIASILSQQGVNAQFAGASIIDRSGQLVVEGVSGLGDEFMLGSKAPEELPAFVLRHLEKLHEELAATFGPVRTEWVHDGKRVWVVQMHKGATVSEADVLVPGDASHWMNFEVSNGLEALRHMLDDLDDDAGLRLVGQVGMTSHFADLVRKSGIPTRVVAA